MTTFLRPVPALLRIDAAWRPIQVKRIALYGKGLLRVEAVDGMHTIAADDIRSADETINSLSESALRSAALRKMLAITDAIGPRAAALGREKVKNAPRATQERAEEMASAFEAHAGKIEGDK